jgi:hypothetical protein
VDQVVAVPHELEEIDLELQAQAEAQTLRAEQQAKFSAAAAAAKAEAERVRVEAKARADLEAKVKAELAPMTAEIEAAWSALPKVSDADWLEARRHVADLESARDDRRRELMAAFSMSSPDQGGDGPTLDVPAGVASQDDAERAGSRPTTHVVSPSTHT